MGKQNVFNVSRKDELESQLIINQKLYDLKVIDYSTYQAFINHILVKLQKVKTA